MTGWTPSLRDTLLETRNALDALIRATERPRSEKRLQEAVDEARLTRADADKAIAHAAEPRERRSVMSGEVIRCRATLDVERLPSGERIAEDEQGTECGGSLFYEWPRSRDSYNYECARCGQHTFPYTETGASA